LTKGCVLEKISPVSLSSLRSLILLKQAYSTRLKSSKHAKMSALIEKPALDTNAGKQ
jgi:hypothetical protein